MKMQITERVRVGKLEASFFSGKSSNDRVKLLALKNGVSKDRHYGTVKWYSPERYYGFILMPGLPDMYVHGNELKASGITNLLAGQKVSFTIRKDGRKIQAEDLKIE